MVLFTSLRQLNNNGKSKAAFNRSTKPLKKSVHYMKEKLLPRLPLITVSVIGTLSLFLTLRAMFNYLFIMVGQFMGFIPMFILFGDPTTPGGIAVLVHYSCVNSRLVDQYEV